MIDDREKKNNGHQHTMIYIYINNIIRVLSSILDPTVTKRDLDTTNI